MILLKDVVRPSILKLKAYSSARSLNSDLKNAVYLDANESATAAELETGLAWEKTLNRYPRPQPEALLQKFSDIYNVDKNKILITRGSDEAIDILTRATCEPKTDSILIMPPTYGMYEVSADIQNSLTIEAPLVFKSTKSSMNDTAVDLNTKSDMNWVLDLDLIKNKIQNVKNLKIIYICSPNNPTGTVFSKEDIKKVLSFLSTSTLLVIDQAYCEFSPEASVIELLNDYPQLVILRTISKAWGLAGLRLGTLLGHPDLISVLQKVRAPYPIPAPVIELAMVALSHAGFEEMQTRVEKTIKAREKLKSELLKLNSVVQIYPSSTNFLLVEFNNVSEVMDSMRVEKIILRDRSRQIKNTIRITVGTIAENEQVIQCLKNLELL